MIRTLLVSLVLSLSFLSFSLAKDPPADGWVNLLPAGSKLEDNWTTKGNWILDKDGVVALVPRKGEKDWKRYDMYLWANKLKLADFEADFEYKTEKSGNSGFYFHVGDVAKPVETGIEVQIYDSANNKGKLTDHDSGGVIPGVPPTKNAAKPTGEWNRMQVTVKGTSLKVVLNGELVNEVALDKGKLASRPSTGAIGFQDHGLPLWFKNVKVREIK